MKKTRVVVLGGGYSGVTSAIKLSRKGERIFETFLIDKNPFHTKIVNLHKAASQPIKNFRVPFKTLAKKFHFQFVQAEYPLPLIKDFAKLQKEKVIEVDNNKISFDYLIIAQGLPSRKLIPRRKNKQEKMIFWDLESIQGIELSSQLAGFRNSKEKIDLTFLGTGSTGIQFFFEIYQILRENRNIHYTIISMNSRLLQEISGNFHPGIMDRLKRDKNIRILLKTRFLHFSNDDLILENMTNSESYPHKADIVFAFPGLDQQKKIQCNAFGQVTNDKRVFPSIFAVGDVSSYEGKGLNANTAQAAIRKGLLAAENIHRQASTRPFLRYSYKERGYLVSLGENDALGWLLEKKNILEGYPAYILKEGIDKQYDLFLDGWDTYWL